VTSRSVAAGARGWRCWLACLLALLAGCASAERTPPTAIVLISIDTLRPDHLNFYGYGRSTSSGIEDVFAGAVVFENAFSTAPWTAPAMASLFTSLHPEQHLVRHGRLGGGVRGSVSEQEMLSSSLTTLAEVLRDHGFATVGFTTNPHLKSELGFAQGFDHYHLLIPGITSARKFAAYTDAKEVRAAIEADGAIPRSYDKLFLWIHLMDPHAPYYRKRPWVNSYAEQAGVSPATLPGQVLKLRDLKAPGLDPEQKEEVVRILYDGEIRFVLDEVRAMIDGLALPRNTLLILVSDHGESLFEHGIFGHSQSLYDPEIRIPLLIKLPGAGREGRHIADPVSILDVMPTVLDFAGIDHSGQQGVSLLPLIAGGSRDAEPRALFAEHVRTLRQLRSIRVGRFKLVVDLVSNGAALYDLETDPGEEHDVSGERPELVAALRAGLDRHVEATLSTGQAPTHEMEPADVELLKELGYSEP